MPPNKSDRFTSASPPVGFEAKLWLSADTALRASEFLFGEACLRSLSEAKGNRSNNMGTAGYEHVAFGLIFRKDVSDDFLLLA